MYDDRKGMRPLFGRTGPAMPELVAKVRELADVAERIPGATNRIRRRAIARPLKRWLDERIEPNSPIAEALSDIAIQIIVGLLIELALGKGGDEKFGFIAGDPVRARNVPPEEDVPTEQSEPDVRPLVAEPEEPKKKSRRRQKSTATDDEPSAA